MAENRDVPYIVHEGSMTRLERANERLFILIVILVLLLVGTNGAWLYYESQFTDKVETTTVTQELESDDGDAIINDGVHINDGEGKTDSDQN